MRALPSDQSGFTTIEFILWANLVAVLAIVAFNVFQKIA